MKKLIGQLGHSITQAIKSLDWRTPSHPPAQHRTITPLPVHRVIHTPITALPGHEVPNVSQLPHNPARGPENIPVPRLPGERAKGTAVTPLSGERAKGTRIDPLPGQSAKTSPVTPLQGYQPSPSSITPVTDARQAQHNETPALPPYQITPAPRTEFPTSPGDHAHSERVAPLPDHPTTFAAAPALPEHRSPNTPAVGPLLYGPSLIPPHPMTFGGERHGTFWFK